MSKYQQKNHNLKCFVFSLHDIKVIIKWFGAKSHNFCQNSSLILVLSYIPWDINLIIMTQRAFVVVSNFWYHHKPQTRKRQTRQTLDTTNTRHDKPKTLLINTNQILDITKTSYILCYVMSCVYYIQHLLCQGFACLWFVVSRVCRVQGPLQYHHVMK